MEMDQESTSRSTWVTLLTVLASKEKVQDGQNREFNWSSIIEIWGIFRERGLIREIETYRNFMIEDGHIHVSEPHNAPR
jgi:hypothetical protein